MTVGAPRAAAIPPSAASAAAAAAPARASSCRRVRVAIRASLRPSIGHKDPSFRGWPEGARWATLREAAGFGHPAFPQHLMDAMSHTQDTARRTTSGQTLPLVVVFLLTLL